MMKPSYNKIALLLIALGSGRSNAFIPPNAVFSDRTSLGAAPLPSAEDSAKALTDYMVKAHEEKLKLVKEIEMKKDAELKALKEELEALKASRGTSSIELSSSASTLPPPPTGSVEELQAKLASYQQFMADYIVKSSQQKFEAVQAAEKALAQKYEAKLLLLGGSAPTPTEKSTPAPPSKTKTTAVAATENVNPNFAKRNAKLTAAAKEGKNSRWGEAEVKRAASVTVASASTPAIPEQEIPKEVIDADHGLRADGGVGGLTLAERVMMGSNAGTTASSTSGSITVPTKDTALFEKRNAHVIKAASAGKNYRWGDLEVAQVQKYESQKSLNGAADPAPKPANGKVLVDVSEADKGLRSSGGVGGPSLSERVNLGAALINN